MPLGSAETAVETGVPIVVIPVGITAEVIYEHVPGEILKIEDTGHPLEIALIGEVCIKEVTEPVVV